MKHVFTSAGCLALGAAALHAYDPQLTWQQSAKPWTVSATVRGFYDDNITTSPDKVVQVAYSPVTGLPVGTTTAKKESSWGMQVSPSVSLNLPLEQTFISLGYTYNLMYYENRDPKNIDQSSLFTGQLSHQFSPRHNISVNDTFILSSEPTVVDQNSIVTTPLRTDANVMHNIGAIEDTFDFTPRIGMNLAYGNNWYDYNQDGVGSRSALLNRIEQLVRAEVRYTFMPTLVGLLGYSFGAYNYTGDEIITPSPGPGIPPYMSSDRNNTSQYGYVGATYQMSAQLSAAARVGAQYTDYDAAAKSEVNPYADVSVTYVYLEASSVTVGLRHTRNATDVSVVDDVSGLPTLDQETTALYAKVSQQIMPNFTGSVIGQWQNSTFNQGLYDGQNEVLWLAGINFEYVFNQHLSADLGYDYDKLDSDIPNRSYNRNRVYFGVHVTY